jgi:hypothetical protein
VALAIGLLLAGGGTLAADAQTLHIEVLKMDNGDTPEVKMAMPIDLVQAFASSVRGGEGVHVEVLDEIAHEGFDLREFWRQVKDGNIDQFFTLEAEDATIRAWREGGMFRLTVDADELHHKVGDRERAQVEITLPEELMDFLVEQDDTVEPADIVARLRQMGPMTLVQVSTDKETVRIWLD